MLRSPLIALAFVALVWSAVLVAWPDAVLALPFDDAFYYFEIGQRMALGQGSTFDGLHGTNGYHPLWQWICAVAHVVLPAGEGTARLLLLLQVPLVFGGIGLALRGIRAPEAEGHAVDGFLAAGVLGAWLLVPAVTRTGLNGLESAVVVASQGALLGLLGTQGPALHRWGTGLRWGLGLVLAVVLLSRTDGALLTPLVLGAALPAALADTERMRALGRLIPVGIPPTLALGAFLVGNKLAFGTAMQVSGTLKRVPPGVSGTIILSLCAVVVLALAAGAPRLQSKALPRLAGWVRHTWPHLAFQVVLLGYYTGIQTFARQWYFAPTFLWASVVPVALALDLSAMARGDKPDAPPGRAVAPLALMMVLPLLGAAVFTARGIASPDTLAVRKADRAAAMWIDENLPADAVVASWDAGLIGYVAERSVVNLDGVVNDLAWLRALKDGTTGERMRADGVDWVVNHSDLAAGRCLTIDEALERLHAPVVAEVVKRWDYTQQGRINGGAFGVHAMATCVASLAPYGSPPDR